MAKDKKDEELQSRREFFKKAAKGALPIIGAIILAGTPSIIKAAETVDPMGCHGTCYGACVGSCREGCQSTCRYTCSGSCRESCQYTCSGTCSHSCRGGCDRSSR